MSEHEMTMPARAGRRAGEGRWTDLEHGVFRCLGDHGPLTPAEIGAILEISEGEAEAFLGLLARAGKVRIRQVEVGGDYKIAVVTRPRRG
jgi:hypothetical protein